MKHKKIEKIILNIFRLLPVLCLLLFILYICLTGFKKEKTNTYDTTNVEQVIEEETIYTYDLDTITETSFDFTRSYNWSFSNYTGDIYFGDFVISEYSQFDYLWCLYDGKWFSGVGIDSALEYISFYSEDVLIGTFHCTIETIEGNDYYKISVSNFTFSNEEWDINEGYYLYSLITSSYTDNYTIVNKIKYYMNDYVFKYTDTLFNNEINVPFNAFTNAISLNQYSIFYSYLKFSYLYLIYLLLIDFIYLFYNIVAFIPKWLVNEFEKRT